MKNKFTQAIMRFFQTITAWILVGRKQFSKMVREAAAEEDREKVEDAKKTISKDKDLSKELSVKEKETLANLIGRQGMSMEAALLRLCENRFKDAGLEMPKDFEKNHLKGAEPADVLKKVGEIISSTTKENHEITPIYSDEERVKLGEILGGKEMIAAENKIAEKLKEIELENGAVTNEDRFTVTSQILKAELQKTLYDEGFGKDRSGLSFNQAVEESLKKGLAPGKAMIDGYNKAKEDLSHIKETLMSSKEIDGVSTSDLRKTFTDEIKGPESIGDTRFNHIIADHMDGKTLSDAMASEMTKWCEEMGIAADENIFKARLEEDIAVNKLNIENCVKDAMRDMGHEGAVVAFDPNKTQDITDLLHQDAENMEFGKEKSEQIFSNVMDAIRVQESQETVTALSLDELGMDSHQVESVITSVSEYDRSNFSHYPDIKPINGEITTRGQLNALRVCLGKKIYQDANDVKGKNFKALDERGATKEVRQAEKELHKELKTLVSSMEEHNVKTIDELKKAIEYQKEQENLQKEEEKTLTHEDIVAANAINDLAFGLMASNARGMDAVPDGRDVDEIISEVQVELDMPSSALDGIDLDSIEQEI